MSMSPFFCDSYREAMNYELKSVRFESKLMFILSIVLGEIMYKIKI